METIKEIWTKELFQILDVPITIKNLCLLAFVILMTKFFLRLYKAFVNKTLKPLEWFDEERIVIVYRIGKILIYILGIFLIFYSLDLKDKWSDFLNYEIVHEETEEKGFTMKVYNIFLFVLILFIGRMLVKALTGAIKSGLRANPKLDAGQEFTISKMISYSGYILTFLIAVNGAGFNLTGLVFGSAALLLALGLGIQHIFDDLISGLILLFDGTFQVGDVIEVDGLVAQVQHIDIRTSKVLTKEGVIIMLPNRKLTSDKINNWSTSNPISRFNLDVGVAYGSDVKVVRTLLDGVARSHPDVSSSKPIIVLLDEFGDSALKFRLMFWSQRTWDIEVMRSELRFAVHESLAANNIRIPFPQREVHIAEGSKMTF